MNVSLSFFRQRPRLFVRLFCGYNFLIWAVLAKNMIFSGGHTLGFRLIHLALAFMSFAFTAALWPLAKRIDRPPVNIAD